MSNKQDEINFARVADAMNILPEITGNNLLCSM